MGRAYRSVLRALTARQSAQHDQLTQVPLGVLGDVESQAQRSRGNTRAAHVARNGELAFGKRADFRLAPRDGLYSGETVRVSVPTRTSRVRI